jgi:hypothetical protein
LKFGEALCNRFDDPRAKESWEGVDEPRSREFTKPSSTGMDAKPVAVCSCVYRGPLFPPSTELAPPPRGDSAQAVQSRHDPLRLPAMPSV